MYQYIIVCIASIFVGIIALGSHSWIGGDAIPSQFLLDYILSSATHTTNQWGLPGPATGFALWALLPYALLFSALFHLFGSYADAIILGLFLFVSVVGWQKLFEIHTRGRWSAYLLAVTLLVSPYAWLLINRNVLFQLILVASIPWMILTFRNVVIRGSFRNWSIFVIVLALSSGGWLNPAFAIAAMLFVAIYILVYVYGHGHWKKIGIAIVLTFAVASPVILGQINLALHSKELQSDYWNTVVLTRNPLERQRSTNTLINVVAGVNSDTIGNYGYYQDTTYTPWWFTPYIGTPLSILLYIPIILVFIILFMIPVSRRREVAIWLAVMLFFLFMIKSSSGPGGDWFYATMMQSGILKMFRSPQLKFGFEFMAVLLLILAIVWPTLNPRYIKKGIVTSLAVYIATLFVYPLITARYIPPIQRVSSIPTPYFQLRDFLRSHSDYRLGFLLPFNESTWDSNSWGYEGYHILHWMNTGVSFFNRNGLSFNAGNQIGFSAGGQIESKNIQGIQNLQKQGYRVIIYDASSARDARFHFTERHTENLSWLDAQSDMLKKVFSEGDLTAYEILPPKKPNILKPVYYTIKRGDSYQKLVRDTPGLTLETLRTLNPSIDENRLRAGMTLITGYETQNAAQNINP